jgi:hypothetical protein
MTKYNGPTSLMKQYSPDEAHLLMATTIVRGDEEDVKRFFCGESATPLTTTIGIYFFGEPTEDFNLETKASKRLYRAAEKIFERHNGDWIAEATCLVHGEQSLVYNVPDEQVEDCCNALDEAGFRLEGTTPTDEEWTDFYAAHGKERTRQH